MQKAADPAACNRRCGVAVFRAQSPAAACLRRKELIARLRQSLSDPALTPGSMPAKLRDAYGADSDVCTDNLIMVVFAGACARPCKRAAMPCLPAGLPVSQLA